MRHYKAKLAREGRWWMINVPEIDQPTQARRIDEITEMARSLIAVSTGESLDQITVDIASIDVPGTGNIQRSADELALMRDQGPPGTPKTWPPHW